MAFCTNFELLGLIALLRINVPAPWRFQLRLLLLSLLLLQHQCVRERASERASKWTREPLLAFLLAHAGPFIVVAVVACILNSLWIEGETEREIMHLKKKLVLQVIILPLYVCLLLTVRACAYSLVFLLFSFFFFVFAWHLFYLCITIMIIKAAAVH